MATTFKPRSAEAYEQSMGRRSRRLAGPFIAFSGIADGERVLDVGCGTGSLTFALSQVANLARIAAVDYSENFVEAARQRNNDPRITIELADACALPFADASFDRALSLLVLQFIPEADRAVTEMCRVVRPGGVVAAAVWDSFGGRTTDRMFWDTAAIVEPALAVHRAEHYFRPMTRPNEMKTFWTRLGLKDVEETSLLIRMEYASFEDYWGPIGAGETTFGKFVVDLSGPVRRQLELSLRAAYEGGQPDGPRSFAAVALACRGIVPQTLKRE